MCKLRLNPNNTCIAMGNTESNVTSGVKKQAGASMQAIYKLCDLKGL